MIPSEGQSEEEEEEEEEEQEEEEEEGTVVRISIVQWKGSEGDKQGFDGKMEGGEGKDSRVAGMFIFII